MFSLTAKELIDPRKLSPEEMRKMILRRKCVPIRVMRKNKRKLAELIKQ